MINVINLAKAWVVAGALILAVSGGAQAQQTAPAEAKGGFDGYRALAVTAGVVGGAAVAVILTDGLIIPVYAWATGAEMGGMGAAAGMNGGVQGMRAGGVAAMNAAGDAVVGMGSQGYELLRGGIRLLGAVSGGLMADGWYMGK